jgi:ribosomal protein L12E/L44/L45/RPP1/RPP2
VEATVDVVVVGVNVSVTPASVTSVDVMVDGRSVETTIDGADELSVAPVSASAHPEATNATKATGRDIRRITAIVTCSSSARSRRASAVIVSLDHTAG